MPKGILITLLTFFARLNKLHKSISNFQLSIFNFQFSIVLVSELDGFGLVALHFETCPDEWGDALGVVVADWFGDVILE